MSYYVGPLNRHPAAAVIVMIAAAIANQSDTTPGGKLDIAILQAEQAKIEAIDKALGGHARFTNQIQGHSSYAALPPHVVVGTDLSKLPDQIVNSGNCNSELQFDIATEEEIAALAANQAGSESGGDERKL